MLLTFAFSWLLFLPPVLTYYGLLAVDPQSVSVLAVAGLLGPVLAALVMTALTDGRAGPRRWLQRIVLWRVGWRWYLFALLGLPLVMVLGTLLRPGAVAAFDPSAHPFTARYLVAFLTMALIGGPLFEEPGWTGFAQPRLERRYGPLRGGLLLGSVWALWHLPGFLIPSQALEDIPPRGTVLDFVVFALALIGLRLIMIWVANHTQGSVLLAIIMHASWNTFYSAALIRLFPIPSVLGSYLNLTLAAGGLAVLLIVVTRGRLGYRADRAHEPAGSAAATT